MQETSSPGDDIGAANVKVKTEGHRMSPVHEFTPTELATAAPFVKNEPSPSPKRVTWADYAKPGEISVSLGSDPFPEDSLLPPDLPQPMAEHDPGEVTSAEPLKTHGPVRSDASVSWDTDSLLSHLAADEADGVSWPTHALSVCPSDSIIVKELSDPQESTEVLYCADHRGWTLGKRGSQKTAILAIIEDGLGQDHYVYHAGNPDLPTLGEALKSKHWPDWKVALIQEYDSLEAAKVFELVLRPRDKPVTDGLWVFKLKIMLMGHLSDTKLDTVLKVSHKFMVLTTRTLGLLLLSMLL